MVLAGRPPSAAMPSFFYGHPLRLPMANTNRQPGFSCRLPWRPPKPSPASSPSLGPIRLFSTLRTPRCGSNLVFLTTNGSLHHRPARPSRKALEVNHAG